MKGLGLNSQKSLHMTKFQNLYEADSDNEKIHSNRLTVNTIECILLLI